MQFNFLENGLIDNESLFDRMLGRGQKYRGLTDGGWGSSAGLRGATSLLHLDGPNMTRWPQGCGKCVVEGYGGCVQQLSDLVQAWWVKIQADIAKTFVQIREAHETTILMTLVPALLLKYSNYSCSRSWWQFSIVCIHLLFLINSTLKTSH